jgi:citrate lyase subunit beta/citryl-CoA lyase
MWGAEDLTVSVGGRSSRQADGSYRDVARHASSTVLLAAGAAGKTAIDAVFLDMNDHIGLQNEGRDAAASGFVAKACVHPRQVEVVRAAFRPSATDLDWARRVISNASASGVSEIDGHMVDEPALLLARSLVRAAHD